MSKKSKKKPSQNEEVIKTEESQSLEIEVPEIEDDTSDNSDNAVIFTDGEETIELFESEEDGKFRRPRYKKKRKIILISLISFLCLILVAVCTFIGIKLFGTDNYDQTEEFYFTSNYLTTDGASYAQNEKISFELYNYADDLRTSVYDINGFDVKVFFGEDNITNDCKISKSKTTFVKNKREKSVVSIEIPEKYYREKIDVQVKSEPNAILLKGTFTIAPVWSYKLIGKEGEIDARLTISATKATSFTVKWDANELLADASNDIISDSDKDNECTVSLEANSSIEIVFFKKDLTKEYNGFGDGIPVTVSEQDGGEDK